MPICNAPKEPSGAWLQIRTTPSGEKQAGCSVCQAHGNTDSPWGRFETNLAGFTERSVREHGLSRLHRLAVAGSADAPSASEFEAVLQDFAGNVGSNKHMLKWCLNEGMRQAPWNMLLRGTWSHEANADRVCSSVHRFQLHSVSNRKLVAVSNYQLVNAISFGWISNSQMENNNKV